MGLLFNRSKSPAAAAPAKLLNLQVQTSGYGQVVPIVYGQNRIPGKLIWYGDFTPIAHTSKQATGGKGLGGGGSNSTTTYTYTAAVAILLCEGPIVQLLNVWDTKGKLTLVSTSENYTVPGGGGSYQVTQHANYFSHAGVSRADSYSVAANDYGSDGASTVSGTQQTPMAIVGSSPGAGQYSLNAGTATFSFAAADVGKQVTITYVYSVPDSNSNGQPLVQLALTLFIGTRPQTPWSYLTSLHSGQDLGYNGNAYVAASLMDLGSSGSLPNYSYEILGLLPFGGGVVDAEPGAIIADLLTNAFYGVGWDPALLGDFSNFSSYCKANSLFFSPVLDSQQTAAQIIDDLADLANGAAIYSEGLVKLKSYGDTTAIGNGATFVPATTPVYDLTDNDFIGRGGDPITITRKSRADTANDIKIEFVNRANSYNVEIAEEKDDADISIYGLKAANPRQAHAITDATVAKKVAHLERLRSVYIDGGNTYRFTLGWQYVLLEPMDLVTLTDPNLGLSKHPVRITSIKENGAGELDFECEDFPWGTATPTAYPYSSGSGFNPNSEADPGDVNAPIIFEAPDRIAESQSYELWMGVSGGSNWGGCNVWVSVDGTTYERVGTIHGSARTGSLTATLANTADPDTTDTLAVDLSESLGTLAGGTAADCDNFRTLCYVDGELISYQDATLTSANHYNLATRLRRGCFGSPVGSHSSGARFLRIDDAVFIWNVDASLVGLTLHFKFTSFNKSERREQSLANVTDYTFAFNGSFNNFIQIVSNDGTVDFDPASVTVSDCTVRVYGRVSGTPTPGHQTTFTRSDKTTFTVAAASFTGQALLTTFFALYNPWTGSIYLLTSYPAMTAALYNGHVNIGVVVTPNSGGTGGTTGGGGGGYGGGDGNCPCVWMEDLFIPMGEIVAGEELWCLEVSSGHRYLHAVESSQCARARCVMLVAANGAIWAGSRSTPFDLPDGRSTTADSMLEELMATDRGPGTALEWSRVLAAHDIGEQDVQRISLGGRTFACGVPGKPRVYSHNLNKF